MIKWGGSLCQAELIHNESCLLQTNSHKFLLTNFLIHHMLMNQRPHSSGKADKAVPTNLLTYAFESISFLSWSLMRTCDSLLRSPALFAFFVLLIVAEFIWFSDGDRCRSMLPGRKTVLSLFFGFGPKIVFASCHSRIMMTARTS